MRIERTIIRFDWILLLTVLALTAVGLVVMYGIGISRPEVDLFLFQKQFVSLGIGLTCVAAFAFIDYRQLRSLAVPIYLFGVALLAGVLLFGTTIRGTRGWYVIGGLSFQPVEIAKVCLIIYLAASLVRFAHTKVPWHAMFGSLFFTLVYVGFVLMQPDFGSAMVMLTMWLLTVLFVGLPWRKVFLIVGISIAAAIVTWTFILAPYQKDRFMAFLYPSLDERGAGYNVIQAGIAIGSGGLFGKGIGEGSQSRLRFLPEAATDFTFAVIGEEMGFIGICFVLGLFGLLFFRFFIIAKNAEDDFATILLFGIGTVFLIHLTINAGMNLGIMPVTGIPLPFVSGASSFLIAVYLAIALAQSISVHRTANTASAR